MARVRDVEKHRERSRKWYWANRDVRLVKMREARRKRLADPAYREARNAKKRAAKKTRYWSDPEFRERHLADYRKRLKEDKTFRARRYASAQRWRSDPENRKRRAKQARESYQENAPRIRARVKERYRSDPAVKARAIMYRDRRRARMRSLPSEPITIEEIAERDGWRCHICGRRVQRTRASIDHLIPIAADGPHLKHNVALAHLRCNQRRGAGRIPAQLRLV